MPDPTKKPDEQRTPYDWVVLGTRTVVLCALTAILLGMSVGWAVGVAVLTYRWFTR